MKERGRRKRRIEGVRGRREEGGGGQKRVGRNEGGKEEMKESRRGRQKE